MIEECNGSKPGPIEFAVPDHTRASCSDEADSDTSSLSENGNGPTHLPRVEKMDSSMEDYPEGGLEAWLVVLGSFCGMMACFGFMNTVGVFQAYLSRNQLQNYSESAIGWIFSVYVFLTFFCGLQIGPIFDAKGPRMLIILGSILFTLSVLLMGISTQYWHFMLTIGVLAGMGSSLMFTPAVGSVSHFFFKRRGTATGIAAGGGSLGGVVFPLMLRPLLSRIGWAWSTRVLALIIAVLCVCSILLVHRRIKPETKPTFKDCLPDLRILSQTAFALTTAGIFFMEWGLFIPIAYIVSYVLASRIGDDDFAFNVLAVLNAGSCLGRFLPGIFADRIGRFNAMIGTLLLCGITTLALWLPESSLGGGTSDTTTTTTTTTVAAAAAPSMRPLIVTYALLFGFASGANISLTPVCVGQLCRTKQYGRYYATAYTLVSFGTLTGIPIAGALLQVARGRFYGMVLFTGACYVLSVTAFILARWVKVGWGVKKNGKWVIF